MVIYNSHRAKHLCPLSNAEKQHRHREQLQKQGLVHIQGWVTPTQAKLIKKIMAGEIRSGKQLITSNRPVNLETFAKDLSQNNVYILRCRVMLLVWRQR